MSKTVKPSWRFPVIKASVAFITRATMGSLWFVLYFLVLRDRYWTIVYNRDTCERIRTNKKTNRDI